MKNDPKEKATVFGNMFPFAKLKLIPPFSLAVMCLVVSSMLLFGTAQGICSMVCAGCCKGLQDAV